MYNADLILGFGLLFVAAALASAATPRPRTWNNSRAATQRDVADVLRGRGKRDGRADQAIIFAVIVMSAVLCYAAIS